MDNKFKEYLQTTNNFSENEINDVCLKILNNSNEEERLELLDIYLKRSIEFFKYTTSYNKNEIINKIDLIIKQFSTFEDTNEILINNNYTLDNILKELEINTQEEKDFEKIKNVINSIETLDNELFLKIVYEMDYSAKLTDEEYNILMENLTQKTHELIEKENPEKTQEERLEIFENLNKELVKLYSEKTKNQEEKIEVEENNEKEEEQNEIKAEKEIIIIERKIEELKKKKENEKIDEEYINKTSEEIQLEINKLKELRIKFYGYNTEFNISNINNLDIKAESKDLKYINDLNSKINKLEKIKESKTRKYYNLSTEEIKNRIKQINEIQANNELNISKKELEYLYEKRRKFLFGLQLENEEKFEYEMINNRIKELQIKIDKLAKEDSKSLEELNNELNDIEEKRRKLLFGLQLENDKKIEYENLNKRYKQLKLIIKEKEENLTLSEELKELNEELNRRNNNLNQEEKDLLNNLENIKNAYYSIINESINKFSDKADEENIINDIEEFVNNHQLISVINEYENPEKLRKELIEDIKSKLNIKTIEITEEKNKINNKGNNKKMWMKALAAVSGFVTGLGMSCVPGIGTIKMVAAGAKLTASAINFVAKRNPEGKCASIKNFVGKKTDIISEKIENRFPGIIEKTNNMKAKLKESPLNCFINGVAVGYITGNLIEIFTGETILEHLNPEQKTPTVTIVPEEPIAQIEAPIEDTIINTDIFLEPGEHIDLSSLDQGYVSSYSNTPVNLMTESAKNLSFDKANIVNGEEFWHFLKPDGQGYAWFKADDVRNLIESGTKAASKTI